MTTTPPLLSLAAGRKVRARRVQIPAPKELALHITVAKLLKDHALPEWRWFHVPSGEERPAKFVEQRGKIVRFSRQGAKLKAMGVRRGIPDFVLISPYGSVRFLELKRAGGKLTEDQDAFRMHCVQHGIPHVVAYTLDEVLLAFDAWGCVRLKSPPARTGTIVVHGTSA